ncbi:MAG: hypothetical protein WEF50_21305 [Myxococcota bacterium]
MRYHNEKFSELTFDESDFSFVEISAEQGVPFPGKQITEQTAARHSVGEAAQQDVLRAGLERGMIEERLVTIERARTASAAMLNAWLGREAAIALPSSLASEPPAPLGDLEELRGDAGIGSDVAKRIAAPLWGGLVSLALLTLAVIPALYVIWRERELGRESSITT